ncbi:hypothetical protein ACKKBH_06175 [Aeromonas dhakensis]|uniref:hypothetical protein n=1 Tax=Aeromonas dhakensis TaxID=196024 RepID=UPI0038F81085
MLSDIVSVSGLLLTLVTFLFNLAWPRITVALEVNEDLAGDKARARAKKSIIHVVFLVVLPILISFFLLFYVNLPSAIEIISTSTLDLWDFNVDKTLYIMVVWALLAFVIINLSILAKLLLKIRRLQ